MGKENEKLVNKQRKLLEKSVAFSARLGGRKRGSIMFE